jgi:hypothetical protein
MPNDTGLYMNWSGVTVTPQGGAAVTINHVLDIKIDRSSMQEVFYGDARKFPAIIKNTGRSRRLDIVGGNVAKLTAIGDGVPCTVVGVLNHVEAGIGTDALTFTLVNAVLGAQNSDGSNNKIAGATASFTAYAEPDDSDPLTIVKAV